MTCMLPSYLSALLNMCLLSYVNCIEKIDDKIVVTRNIDGYSQKLSACLPVVLSVTDHHVNLDILISFKAIAAARKKKSILGICRI